MCRLQFYRNMQKKSTNPSIRTLVSTLQCLFLCAFLILPYAHPANLPPVFYFLKSIFLILGRKDSAKTAQSTIFAMSPGINGSAVSESAATKEVPA